MKQQRVRRLALSYLAVIMTLSLVFSVIIYAITSVQLNRPLPPGEHAQQPPELFERQFNRRLEQRNRETRGSVIMSLAALNSMMLLVGYWPSVLVVPSSWMSSHMTTGCKIHRPVTVMQMNWTIGWRTCGIRD